MRLLPDELSRLGAEPSEETLRPGRGGLADPAHVFGPGNVVPVVPVKTVLAEGPAFAATIDRVSALLTEPVMRDLNADIDLAHGNPADVARAFLRAHGLVPPATP